MRQKWYGLLFALSCALSAQPGAKATVASNFEESSKNQQWKNLFPVDMYEFLQCQVCQTPGLIGSVHDSGCDYETVDKAVSEHFHPLLLELSKLTFFRYFKVDLGKECPFWQDEGMCASRDCAVCECPNDEIPPVWYKMEQKNRKRAPSHDPAPETKEKPCDQENGEGELSRVDRKNAAAGESFKEWSEEASPEVWSSQGDEGGNMVYINLLENPERFTGYSGYQAERIWNAIYQENCFTPPSGQEKSAELAGMCFEERVYYRLISGLQASINTHIALRYKYEGYWGPNPSLFVERVGKHPQRLQNLYFTYLFVMRALGRYRNELLSYDYSTGNDEDDNRVREILRLLVADEVTGSVSSSSSSSSVSCPKEHSSVLNGFDEQALFRVQRAGMSYDQFIDAKKQKRELELQFRAKFQNVSRIMDCVTCEKCRLWGTLQTMGLGTAIKILLHDDVKTIPPLHRNELIALVNVANNLARSVDGVRMLRNLEFFEAVKLMCGITLSIIAIAMLITLWMRKRNLARLQTKETRKKKL